MTILVEGKNIDLTQAIKDYANEKLNKLIKHFEPIIKGHDIHVKLSTERNPRIPNNNKAEVTIFVNGKIIRSEESSEDMYASIDLVSNKLERQLKKYKDIHYRSQQHIDKKRAGQNLELVNIIVENEENNKQKNKIIKSKKFKLLPLTPEEAVQELDLIEHDFYVFINSKTKQINTIYRRKDGNYGLIEPAS